MAVSFRASAPVSYVLPGLGPLQELPGTWMGDGFSLIERPDKHNNTPFFLQLNATQEVMTFTQIGSPIPNRGSAQDDISFLGAHYLQQISDAVTNGALHIEPGIWINVPETTEPAAPPSVVRLATIPHGDALLAQGDSRTVAGPPTIEAADSTPISNADGQPITNADYLAPFSITQPPPGIPEHAIINPNVVLTDAIAKQTIVETVVLSISTQTAVGGIQGGIQNIPFVVKNANATRMNATFWIEKVHDPAAGEFMQLQYTQTVMLDFLDIQWPHITVATLVKQ